MTAEWVGALASLATFVVIAASAVVALIQLRHMRNSNQLAVFNEFRRHMESEEFRVALSLAMREFPERSSDSAFRQDVLRNDSREWLLIRELLNYLDYTGALVKHGMVDRELACDLFYAQVVGSWTTLREFIASRRALAGYRVWEDYEYLYIQCQKFRERYPEGTFPKDLPPAPLPEPWPEVANMRGSASKRAG